MNGPAIDARALSLCQWVSRSGLVFKGLIDRRLSHPLAAIDLAGRAIRVFGVASEVGRVFVGEWIGWVAVYSGRNFYRVLVCCQSVEK